MSNKLTPPAELPNEQDLRAVLAYNMRLFRVNKGWSQEELARQCGLDRTYVSAVERKRWNIALSNIEKMATAFGRGGVSVAAAAAGTAKPDDQSLGCPAEVV